MAQWMIHNRSSCGISNIDVSSVYRLFSSSMFVRHLCLSFFNFSNSLFDDETKFNSFFILNFSTFKLCTYFMLDSKIEMIMLIMWNRYFSQYFNNQFSIFRPHCECRIVQFLIIPVWNWSNCDDRMRLLNGKFNIQSEIYNDDVCPDTQLIAWMKIVTHRFKWMKMKNIKINARKK